MKFLKPEIFWHLVWILPVMLAVFLSAWHRRKKILNTLTGLEKADGGAIIFSPGMRIFRFLLLTFSVICLITALARPAWDYETINASGSGRDLMIVFDTSKSMLSRDVQPSRLDHAKWFVRELVKLNPLDRFGLISFAGAAFQECPLTVDKTSFLQYISELDTSTIPIGGTNIEQALTTALDSFSAAEAIHRAVILITDGDELTGNSKKALEELNRKKIPLFVVGIGNPAQPSIIQYKDEKGANRILKDASGNTVNSPLNEKMLIELAQKTGGIYVRSTAADTGLNAIENRIRKLNAAEYTSASTQKPIERFAYPLWMAFIAILLWAIISERGRKKKLAMLLFLALISCSLQAQTPLNKTQTEQEKKKLTPEQLFNKALQLHTNKISANEKKEGADENKNSLNHAEEFYLRALSEGAGPELSNKVYQNLGALYQKRGLNEAKEAMALLHKENLQGSLDKIKISLDQLRTAEKYYQESMSSANKIEDVSTTRKFC